MLMVGDQIMTDIRGANAAGIRNVLVQPIVDTDGWNTRINRFFERKIMKYLSKTSRNDMERRIRMTEAIHCIGCGAIIQTENPHELGYTPKQLSKRNGNREVYCQRCFRLRHYNDIQDVQLTDDDFYVY